VLSLRHQTVHVYRLDAEGCLTDVTSVGAHCDPGDDALLRQRAALSEAVEQLPGQSAPASGAHRQTLLLCVRVGATAC
jgi:hypothetical protein